MLQEHEYQFTTSTILYTSHLKKGFTAATPVSFSLAERGSAHSFMTPYYYLENPFLEGKDISPQSR